MEKKEKMGGKKGSAIKQLILKNTLVALKLFVLIAQTNIVKLFERGSSCGPNVRNRSETFAC